MSVSNDQSISLKLCMNKNSKDETNNSNNHIKFACQVNYKNFVYISEMWYLHDLHCSDHRPHPHRHIHNASAVAHFGLLQVEFQTKSFI